MRQIFFPLFLISLFFIVSANYQHVFEASASFDENSPHSQTISDILAVGEKDLFLGGISCGTCLNVARTLRMISKTSLTHNSLIAIGKQICIRWKIAAPDICRMAVPNFAPWLFQVLRNPLFKAKEYCGMSGICPYDSPGWDPIFPKPAPSEPRNRVVKPDGEKKHVLHLSDWHYDSEYREGYEADCGEPLCCRFPHVPSRDNPAKKPAGLFGEFTCDTPKPLAKSVVEQAQKLFSYDFVLMSGDLPPHDVWASTDESVVEAEGEVANDLNVGFPNTTIYMTIGNHEGSPSNYFPSYDTPNVNVTWLYKSLAKQWKHWLPDSALSTFTKYGYYSTRRPQDNLRIVVINTNFEYLLNWWIFVAGIDPDSMLHWLINELQEAEDAKEDVYILGHIPSGSTDACKYFTSAFDKIIARYNDTIIAQFYGHSHKDRIQISYEDQARTKPLSVGYICPSVTPYVWLNPGFRVYEIDKATNVITNHFTYVMNLTESNDARSAKWYLEYDAKSAFGLSGLAPLDWHELTQRMESGDEGMDLVKKYIRFTRKSISDEIQCDENCRKNTICSIKTARSFWPCLDNDNAHEELVEIEVAPGVKVTKKQLVIPEFLPPEEPRIC